MANGNEFKVGDRVCLKDYPDFNYLCGTVSEVNGDDVTFVENEGDVPSEASWTFQRGDLVSEEMYRRWEEIRLEILASNWCQNHKKWSMPTLFIDKKPSLLCEKSEAKSTVATIKPMIINGLKNISVKEIYLPRIDSYEIINDK